MDGLHDKIDIADIGSRYYHTFLLLCTFLSRIFIKYLYRSSPKLINLTLVIVNLICEKNVITRKNKSIRSGELRHRPEVKDS